MGVEKIIELAAQYGVFGALLVYMIIIFTRLSNKMIEVIERNSEVIGSVCSVIEKCKHNERSK
jgi:hypothetical protein